MPTITPNLIAIERWEDPRVDPYRHLKRVALQQMSSSNPTPKEPFVAEGHKVVKLLLESSLKVESILTHKQQWENLVKYLSPKATLPAKIYLSPKPLLEKIVGFSLHQGMMALGLKPSSVPIEHLAPQLIWLNGLSNPENIGNIVRSATALGFESFFVDPQCADPFLRRSARVSMGSLFQTKIHYSSQSKSPDEIIQEFKKRNYVVIGTESCTSAKPLEKFEFPPKYVLVIGSEGNGVSPEILKNCDVRLQISTLPSMRAINASNASAIFFHWAKTHSFQSKKLEDSSGFSSFISPFTKKRGKPWPTQKHF